MAKTRINLRFDPKILAAGDAAAVAAGLDRTAFFERAVAREAGMLPAAAKRGPARAPVKTPAEKAATVPVANGHPARAAISPALARGVTPRPKTVKGKR